MAEIEKLTIKLCADTSELDATLKEIKVQSAGDASKKELSTNNKVNGPLAIALQLSAAICDTKGKALSRDEGNYCIYPHSLTIPISTAKIDKNEFKKILHEALEPLISQTVNWHKNLTNIEEVIAEWEAPL